MNMLDCSPPLEQHTRLGDGFCTIFGIGLFVVLGPVILRADGGSPLRDPGFLFFIAGIAISFPIMAWRVIRRRVYEIKVTDAGTIMLERLIGTTILQASEIVSLEGYIHLFSRDYNTAPMWELQIHTAGRTLVYDDAEGALEFVDVVRCHNPNVWVTGEWPMGRPPA